MKNYLRREWKLLVTLLTVLALLLFAILSRDQFIATFHNLFHINGWLLLLLIPIEMLNYHAQTKVYQKLFAAFGIILRYPKLLRIAIELNFVNHVFPSGGVTGISYFGFRVRQHNIGAGRATLIQTVKLILLFVSFEPLLFLGLILLGLAGHASNEVIFIATMLTMLIIFGTLVFAYVIGSIERVKTFVSAIAVGINHLIHFIRPTQPETFQLDKVELLLEEFHRDFTQLSSRFDQLVRPFWWSMLANVTELLAVYVVYLAFGTTVNIGAIIIAYAVANFAGLISVLPGGTGIYEGLMTITLVAAGVPAALSLPVTVTYRVLITLIQIPLGFLLYQQTLHREHDWRH